MPCNLPLLDDEGDLLRGMLGRFRRALSYEPSDEVQIHHYASLDLLDQKIFTRDRPKSRLATEYKALADAIASSNVADPDGAKLFLTKLLARWPREISARRPSRIPASARRIDAQLKQILVRDWEDTDILRMLAQVNARQGDLNEAVRRLGQVVSRDADTLEDHLLLAEWLLTTESFDDVQRTIDRLLNDEDSSPAHVIAALRLLSRSEMPPPPDLDKRAAILHLSIDELVRVVSSLNASRSQVKLTGLLASALTQREFMKLVEDPDSSLKAALSLALIGAGHFSEAKMLLDATNLEKVSPDRRMRVLFNSAMAEWGATGRPPSSTFEKVIQLHDNIGTNEKAANYFQCIALAHKIIGNSDEALHFLSRARTRAGEQVRSFSCWSYLEKGTLGFIEDLEEMLAWVRRDEPLPQVLRESLPVTPGSVVYYSDDGGA